MKSQDRTISTAIMNHYIQLAILWFVVLIFIQTSQGNSGPLVSGIELLALILAYIIPITITISLMSRLLP